MPHLTHLGTPVRLQPDPARLAAQDPRSRPGGTFGRNQRLGLMACLAGTGGPPAALACAGTVMTRTRRSVKGHTGTMWGSGSSAGWLWLGIGLLAAAGGTVIALTLAHLRRPRSIQPGQTAQDLDELFALGNLDDAAYRQRRAALNASPPGRWHWNTALVIALAVIVGLGAASVALATTAASSPSGPAAAPGCTTPGLPGQVVDVRLWDMRGMMGGRYPGGGSYPGGMGGGGYGPGGMMGGGSYPGGRPTGQGRWAGMMHITAVPASVSAGTVSFRVWNTGGLTHELVILPLPATEPGTRPISAQGRVSEQGSLGEASATCAAGAGQGITAGATGWVTLRLAPGRYELICNLPGHYARGMFTELDVR